jgi:transitional endoplasmic reticulum ATPase
VKLAAQTESFTGAELAAVANSAAVASIERHLKEHGKEADKEAGTLSISMADFEEAIEDIKTRRASIAGH